MHLRLFPRGNFHRAQTLVIPRQHLQLLRNRLRRTNGNNKSIYAIINYVRTGGMRGSNNWCPLRHRFGDGKPESLEERWQKQDIVPTHFQKDAVMTHARQPAMSANRLVQWRQPSARLGASRGSSTFLAADYSNVVKA